MEKNEPYRGLGVCLKCESKLREWGIVLKKKLVDVVDNDDDGSDGSDDASGDIAEMTCDGEAETRKSFGVA